MKTAEPVKRIANSLAKGGCGKSIVARIALAELTRPKGLWREYWLTHIRNISPTNRLPRGFKEPHPLINLDE